MSRTSNQRGFYLNIGTKTIDLENPAADQLDMDAIEDRLKCVRRFSNDPNAITVWHHEHFVALMVRHDPLGIVKAELADACQFYARIHDHPEAITGDLPSPVKDLMVANGNMVFRDLDAKLQTAFFHKFDCVGMITGEVKRIVAVYDRVAVNMEWRYAMNRGWPTWVDPEYMSMEPAFIRRCLAESSTL